MDTTVTLPCLSLRQPWAWLLVNGWKNVENRDRRTNIRGRVLIHAAKTCTGEEWEACALFVAQFAPKLAESMPRPAYIDLGGIVGAVTILDCVSAHTSEWFCGPYGYVCADAQPLPFIPCRGFPSFWRQTVPASAINPQPSEPQ